MPIPQHGNRTNNQKYDFSAVDKHRDPIPANETEADRVKRHLKLLPPHLASDPKKMAQMLAKSLAAEKARLG